MTINLTMRLAKTTPGALRYQEVNAEGGDMEIKDGAKVGTLYIRKSALDGDQPKQITVQIAS